MKKSPFKTKEDSRPAERFDPKESHFGGRAGQRRRNFAKFLNCKGNPTVFVSATNHQTTEAKLIATIPKMRPGIFQSPASNYDRINSTPNPRIRQASMAFGFDFERPQQTPPMLRSQAFQRGDLDSSGEPNYRSVLDDEPPSTSNSSQRGFGNGHRGNEGPNDPNLALELIESLGDSFGLSSTEKSDVKEIFQHTDSFAREVATVCFFRSQFARLEKSINEKSMASSTIIQHQGDQAYGWKGGEGVRSFIREKIREALVGSHVQAYATNFTTDNDPVLDSLENHIVGVLVAAPNKVPDYNLPEDFRSSEPTADTAVRKVIKEIAKTERAKFQDTSPRMPIKSSSSSSTSKTPL
ncbi:uncharacterized protein MELLADRAFT_86351 [Melampsora larici-populina 98AG31]|uniref:Uncharacterized protein n=1 Tax=Melampsora larici-populina (strain 98AG31 / pathotype 3-4-7) TaxID=747676 RepID=F4RLI1_MELLP|nr:uncharacterized protein MELLADRAFT_86351 [Melampsora larici-populina 98AG31]EGG06541.1 hypothetical protein MELLADRAFT_86351 [Melampsora larici-populina 98AG31]